MPSKKPISFDGLQILRLMLSRANGIPCAPKELSIRIQQLARLTLEDGFWALEIPTSRAMRNS